MNFQEGRFRDSADVAPAAPAELPLHGLAANEARNSLPSPRLDDIPPRNERKISGSFQDGITPGCEVYRSRIGAFNAGAADRRDVGFAEPAR